MAGATQKSEIGLVAAVSIGVGGMIGAGIFSILGVVLQLHHHDRAVRHRVCGLCRDRWPRATAAVGTVPATRTTFSPHMRRASTNRTTALARKPVNGPDHCSTRRTAEATFAAPGPGREVGAHPVSGVCAGRAGALISAVA